MARIPKVRLSQKEQTNRMDTLRGRLQPHVTDRGLLQRILEDVDWDIERAYRRWHREHRRAQKVQAGEDPDDISSSSSSDDSDDSDSDESGEEIADDDGNDENHNKEAKPSLLESMCERPVNENPEQERRDAALALRIHVQELTDDQVYLSPSEAILLLHRSQWELDTAAARFTTLQAARLELQVYDHMRTSLPKDVDREDSATMLQQDERLATLINITGRPDWFSLKLWLEHCDWNLILAVQLWFNRGIDPAAGQKGLRLKLIRVGVDEQPRQWPTNQECEAPQVDDKWGEEPELYAVDDPESTASDQGSQSGLKTERARADGFLLSNDANPRATAKRGNPDPTKFLVEYIQKGQYWYNRFQHDILRWPDLEAHGQQPRDPNLPLFDWDNQQHLNWLNAWRRQVINRATGGIARGRTQAWSQEEIDFLIALTEELYEQVKADHPDRTDDELLPLTISTAKKKEWEKRMNEKFTGTVQDDSGEPRKDRKFPALMTQRSRVRTLVERFKVKADKKYFSPKGTKQAKMGKKRNCSELSDGEDKEAARPATRTKTGDKDGKDDDDEEVEEGGAEDNGRE